jgi:hypothetical protein
MIFFFWIFCLLLDRARVTHSGGHSHSGKHPELEAEPDDENKQYSDEIHWFAPHDFMLFQNPILASAG